MFADMLIAWVYDAWNTDIANTNWLYDPSDGNKGPATWMNEVMNQEQK